MILVRPMLLICVKSVLICLNIYSYMHSVYTVHNTHVANRHVLWRWYCVCGVLLLAQSRHGHLGPDRVNQRSMFKLCMANVIHKMWHLFGLNTGESNTAYCTMCICILIANANSQAGACTRERFTAVDSHPLSQQVQQQTVTKRKQKDILICK